MKHYDLQGGRRLTCDELGARDGFPVFYFHGTPSCRLEAQFTDAAAKAQGYRIIAIDRPGFGRSPYVPGRRFADWPADVCRLADLLEIGEFGVACYSGGGPYGFVCGARVEAHRLRFVAALAPWGPVNTPEVREGLNPVDRNLLALARRAPRQARAVSVPLGLLARYWPSAFVFTLRQMASPPEREALRDERFRSAFCKIQVEAFARGGRGAAHDAALAYGDWEFKLADVRVPTRVCLGDRDRFVPRAMGKRIEQEIPNVDFRWGTGEGHFAVHRWFDLFRDWDVPR